MPYYTKNIQLTIVKLNNDINKAPSPLEKLILEPFTEFRITEILDYKNNHFKVLTDELEGINDKQSIWIDKNHFDLHKLEDELDLFSVVPEDKLKAIFPEDIGCIPYLNNYFRKYNITDRTIIIQLLAIIGLQSEGLTIIDKKNNNFYRPRGILMVGNESDYKAFELQQNVCIYNNPDLVGTDYELAVHFAIWFWAKLGVDNIAKTYSLAKFQKLTKLVTGKRDRWKQRIKWLEKVKKVI